MIANSEGGLFLKFGYFFLFSIDLSSGPMEKSDVPRLTWGRSPTIVIYTVLLVGCGAEEGDDL